METILMRRIFTAIANEEDQVLDQIEKDIATAKESGSLITDEYDLRRQLDGSITIKDKVNNEVTRAVENDNNIELSPVRSLIVGSSVTWVDGSGTRHIGTLMSTEGELSKVLLNGKLITVKTINLSQGNGTSTKNYSKARASMFLVDENGNLRAYGWLQSLSAMKKAHPKWKIITNYDWNALNNGLKNIRQFSESLQKHFTRSTRRWAVCDKNMKLVGIFDVTNAKGLVKLNPGYSMMKEKDWNFRTQPKVSGFKIG